MVELSIKVIWALDRDLVRSTSPGLHPIIELDRGGRELPAFQNVDPAFHLGEASHHVRLGPGSKEQA